MIMITGFADEISHDLEVQLDVLESENIRHLELRGVWGKNVLKLTEDEIVKVKQRLAERGVGVSSIGSPLGKIQITDDFGPHYEDAKHAVRLAKLFGAQFVRVFSFYIPRGEHDQYRDEVMERMKRMTEIAEQEDVVLLHENEGGIYGDNGERCLDILQTISSPHLRAAFDPANYVQCGVNPFTKAYPLVKDYIEYIHIKDAIMGSGAVVPCGEGDGEVRELFGELSRRGFTGFMSLEPHLKAAGKLDGLSNPELFVVASKALKSTLAEQNMQWS